MNIECCIAAKLASADASRAQLLAGFGPGSITSLTLSSGTVYHWVYSIRIAQSEWVKSLTEFLDRYYTGLAKLSQECETMLVMSVYDSEHPRHAEIQLPHSLLGKLATLRISMSLRILSQDKY